MVKPTKENVSNTDLASQSSGYSGYEAKETNYNTAENMMPADAEDLEENQEPIISNLPQEITESYGTGVKIEPGYNIGDRQLREEQKLYTSTSPKLSGGDVDAAWEEAQSVGEEAVGGTVATPDQSVVDELGAAVGLEMDDQAVLRTNEILEGRDAHRWELNPSSSEDYEDRR